MKIRITYISSIICLFASRLFSQGIVNNGAHIVFSGGAQVYIQGNYKNESVGLITPSSTSTITLTGNWRNNSSQNYAFAADGGGVVLAGGAQDISGSNPTAFYNLSLTGNGIKTLGPGQAVSQTTVGGQSAFTGVLSLGTSTLELSHNTLNITNSAAGAITRSTGYIVSESPSASNPSIIRWYHRTTTGPKVYPFGVDGSYIPLTLHITSAMANSGAYVEVSTRTTASPNNQPWAAGVSHMHSPNMSYTNGSDPVVIDRWWQINNSHAITADATFSYRGSENTLHPPYNTGLIGAQYWAGGWLPNNANYAGTPVVNTGVGSVTATGLTAFGPWVLSAHLSPLPIELLFFEGKCSGKDAILNWCTASETSNDYFSVEQSVDGINFNRIGRIPGAGTSNEKHCYNYKATSLTDGINYFRLRQTDKNLKTETSSIISVEACDRAKEPILIASDGGKEIGIIYSAPADQLLQLSIYNSLGQIVEAKAINMTKGNNNLRVNLSNLSEAVYYVAVYNATEHLITKKIVIWEH